MPSASASPNQLEITDGFGNMLYAVSREELQGWVVAQEQGKAL